MLQSQHHLFSPSLSFPLTHLHNPSLPPHNFSSNKPSSSSDSKVVCSYSCCSGCLFNLHTLMQKYLIHEWRLKGNEWTVEDVHDVVASLSVNLHSAVRKLCSAESSANSFDKKLMHGDCGNLFEYKEMCTCECKSSGNRLIMPTECSCHSRSESVIPEANSSWNAQHGLNLKFIYRNGVLAPVDPDEDVSFHCKFETLCLCSLIEWIEMTKQPL